MGHLKSTLKRRIKQVPWLYGLCLRLYHFLKSPKQSLKSYIKSKRWLYKALLALYFSVKKIQATLLTTIRKIPTRKQLRDIISKYPHLYIYACAINNISRGKISHGLKNIANQISIDWHNWQIFRKNRLAHARLHELYQDAILCCIKHRVNRWWDFLPNDRFDSVQTLHVFLLECVLHRAGDYHEYIRIKDELRHLSIAVTSQEDCFLALARYYANTMEEIEAGVFAQNLALVPDKQPFIISFSVWGKQYMNMLLNYCLPSLLTEGNLPALCKARQPIFYIHTNPEGMRLLEQAPAIEKIRTLGVLVEYRMINEALVERFDDDARFKYWHLGMVQSLDLYFAKSLGADFHLLLPDTIYSDCHFAGILNAVSRGHKVVTRLGLSTRMEGICPEIERYRHNDIIQIPAGDLAALSVRHIHSASWSWIATNKDMTTELPNVYMIAWEGKDTLHMLAAHQTILYLDHEIISTIPKRFYMTLDSELDKIVPVDLPMYCPRPEDEIYLVEVTSEKQRPTPLTRNPIQEFARLFWHSTQASMTYWRLFDLGVVDSLNRNLIPERGYMSDDQIRQAKEAVKSGLLKRYPVTTKEQAHLALDILQVIEQHPNAKSVRAEINEIKQMLHKIEGVRLAKPSSTLALTKASRNVLEKFYQEAILCCMRHHTYKWWNFLANTKFDSLITLQVFLRECVLRRAGDYHEFIRIRYNLRALSLTSDANEAFFDKFTEHYGKSMEEISAGHLLQGLDLDRSRRPFVIGFSVWGEQYLGMLLNYCLPSLLAEGNLPALCKERQPIFFIHTNAQSKAIIEQSEVMKRVKDLNVLILYQMVNEELVKHFGDDPGNKYWHLGMVQSLDLYFAKNMDADYHLLMPDTVYSDRHFVGILKAVERGQKAIIRLILSTRMEGICPEVDAYRHNGVISVPAGDLAAFSVKHIHSASKAWIITNRDIATEASNSHVVVWEGKDTLHMYSPHQTILYLDREILRKIPNRYYMTLDSELEKIIPEDCSIYCPKPEDAICLVEATPEKQRPTELVRNPIKEFCRLFWYGGAQESMSYWRIFSEAVIDPLNRDKLPGRDYMMDDQIREAKEAIDRALLSTYPEVTEDQTQRALELIQAVKSHPEAKHMEAIITESILSLQGHEENTYSKLSAA